MKYRWMISDCYYHSVSNGVFPSHESICVLNATDLPAEVAITLYFEDRDKIAGFSATVPPERTRHIRMDRLVGTGGARVPQDVPYAALVESDTDLAVQYTRMDTSQPEMALMTVNAYRI